MQRRSFLRNAACVGACASLLAPVSRVFAAAPAPEVSMRLDRVGDCSQPVATGAQLQLRVAPRVLQAQREPLRVRAWFATDAGAQAFDLASFGATGASQRLRLPVDPRRLIGFEAANGRVHDDCIATAACAASTGMGSALSAGRYCLTLCRDGVEIAAVDLDVGAVAA
ncbi:MAG: hypothetical protein HYV17_15760 [Xanthomonadales bacterium]|nr:hypothetical protein [Xanthomonadales bacterium]